MGGFSRWVRFYINPKIESSTSFEVVCRFHLRGFTLFMSRDRGCNAFSFNRNMAEYVDGFGDADSDYWLGLNRIKEILDNHSQNRLLVVLIENQYCENYYDNFSIASAFDKYALHLGQYESWTAANCGDSFKNSVNIEGSSFSAPGSDQTSFNCAGTHQGGWWYANTTSCSECDLTGSRDFMIWPTTLGGAPQRFVGLFITKNG
ncbi:hypothetical protein LOTGIDRAFT_131359 [Lottia gigantea]|uniref:Fibrinogen C-terminal domain-containing protein n=1 Tax=Lottia gigantea TaxID=225164 RepID=V3ZR34_LOTGI|nr:hypothetical protein LOTGIDRAFT_131359 [Lottia gigantea]ESO85005.1 hypothetical protein LOTGIDRAFT_131359 [Lottia gigantea]